jgi:hypothetical protein
LRALFDKGAELYETAHFARAAEQYTRAADAARDLGFEDCLLVACMQGELAKALLNHAAMLGMQSTESIDVRRRVFCELLPVTMSLLQRRKDACTLVFEGQRPHEVAFAVEPERTSAAQRGETLSAAREAYIALTIGYGTWINVASSSLHILTHISAADLAATQQQLAASSAFAEDALDFVAAMHKLPALQHRRPSLSESALVNLLRDSSGHDLLAGSDPVFAPVRQGWLRLQRSGILQARGFDAGIERLSNSAPAFLQAFLAAKDPTGLQLCALGSCGAREVHAAQFKKCAACKTVLYCGRACQVADWPAHKAACKAARKAAAAGGAGVAHGSAA